MYCTLPLSRHYVSSAYHNTSHPPASASAHNTSKSCPVCISQHLHTLPLPQHRVSSAYHNTSYPPASTPCASTPCLVCISQHLHTSASCLPPHRLLFRLHIITPPHPKHPLLIHTVSHLHIITPRHPVSASTPCPVCRS